MRTQLATTEDRLSFTQGDRMAKALRVADVSVNDMAEYLGVNRNTVGNYTNDRTPVKDGTLKLWAMRTGVPLEWLLTGETSSTPKDPQNVRQLANGGPSDYKSPVTCLTEYRTQRAS